MGGGGHAHEGEAAAEGDAGGGGEFESGGGEVAVGGIVGDDATVFVEVMEGGGQLQRVVGEVVGFEGVGDFFDYLRQEQHLSDEGEFVGVLEEG